jgi:hypothetical protein
METSDWQVMAAYPNVGTVLNRTTQPKLQIELNKQFLQYDLSNEIQFRLRTRWLNGSFFTNNDDSYVGVPPSPCSHPSRMYASRARSTHTSCGCTFSLNAFPTAVKHAPEMVKPLPPSSLSFPHFSSPPRSSSPMPLIAVSAAQTAATTTTPRPP